MQDYQTIGRGGIAEIEEKKSRFIGHTAFVDCEEQAMDFLQKIRSQHRTARHCVYAYQLREGARTRYSDDGEPQKTSGLPTLEVIRHAGLTDCIIVTVRYFGGVLLGTGGLVRAYTQAANAALEAAEVVSMRECVRGLWCVDYALYESASRLLHSVGAKVEQAEFSDRVHLPFCILRRKSEMLIQPAGELCRGKAELTLSEPFFAPF